MLFTYIFILHAYSVAPGVECDASGLYSINKAAGESDFSFILVTGLKHALHNTSRTHNYVHLLKGQ